MVISYGSHCPCRLARLFAISDGMRWNITESGPLPEQYVGTLTGKHSLNINYDLDPNPEAETAPQLAFPTLSQLPSLCFRTNLKLLKI